MEGRELGLRAIRTGLIGGIVLVYLAAVGMIDKFTVRELVGTQLTLSRLLIALPPFLTAFVALRPRILAGKLVQAPRNQGIVAGAVVGAVAGGVTAVAVAIFQGIGIEAVRGIFLRISDPVIGALTFDQGLAVGAVILVVGGGALGAAGAGVRLIPQVYRRPLFIGLSVTLLVALLQRIIPTALFELGLPTKWLYLPAGGLTYGGAVLVLAISAGLSWLWSDRLAGAVRTWAGERSPTGTRRAASAGAVVVVLGVLAVLPFIIGSILTNTLGSVGIFLLMGLGLNIVVGYAGLLDLGYVAFFAVGAYSLALFTGANLVTSLGETASPGASLSLNFFLALPLVVIFAMFVGLLIGAPVLRLRGDYLAIVTLGFGEIARVLSESKALQTFVGGAQGLRDVTDAAVFGFGFRKPENFYYLVLALVLLAVYVSWRLSRSRVGRAWNAMREDEQVAEAMGISTTRYKLLAFAIGGAIGSLSGVLFAVQLSTVQPGSFVILVSITALAVVVLGGMGSIPGAIVGGLVLIGLPALLSEFEEFRLLIYGAVLIGIMILRPQGLIPNVKRARELTDEEKGQDAWAAAREGLVPEEEAAPVVTGVAGPRKS